MIDDSWRDEFDRQEEEFHDTIADLEERVDVQRDNFSAKLEKYGLLRSKRYDYEDLLDNTLAHYEGNPCAVTVAINFSNFFDQFAGYNGMKQFANTLTSETFKSIVEKSESKLYVYDIFETVRNATLAELVHSDLEITSKILGIISQTPENNIKSLTRLLYSITTHDIDQFNPSKSIGEINCLLDFADQEKDRENSRFLFNLVVNLVYNYDGDEIDETFLVNEDYIKRINNVMSQPEMNKVLELTCGTDKLQSKVMCGLINSEFEVSTTETVAKVLEKYYKDDYSVKKEVSEILSNCINDYEDEEITRDVSTVLEKYQGTPYSRIIVESLNYEVSTINNPSIEDDRIALSAYLKVLTNCNDINNFNLDSIHYYNELLSYKISDQELRENLSMKEINKLHEVHSLYMEACKKIPFEDQKDAFNGFFNIFNSKISYGNNLRSKKQIVREWSSNVIRMIQENAADFHLLQQQLSEVMVA